MDKPTSEKNVIKELPLTQDRRYEKAFRWQHPLPTVARIKPVFENILAALKKVEDAPWDYDWVEIKAELMTEIRAAIKEAEELGL